MKGNGTFRAKGTLQSSYKGSPLCWVKAACTGTAELPLVPQLLVSLQGPSQQVDVGDGQLFAG